MPHHDLITHMNCHVQDAAITIGAVARIEHKGLKGVPGVHHPSGKGGMLIRKKAK